MDYYLVVLDIISYLLKRADTGSYLRDEPKESLRRRLVVS